MKIFSKDEKKAYFQKRDLDFLAQTEPDNKKLVDLSRRKFTLAGDDFLSSSDPSIIKALKKRTEIPSYLDFLTLTQEELSHRTDRYREECLDENEKEGEKRDDYRVLLLGYQFFAYESMFWEKKKEFAYQFPFEEKMDGYQVEKGNYRVYETTVPSVYTFEKTGGNFSRQDEAFIPFYQENLAKILCQRQQNKTEQYKIYIDKDKEKSKVYMIVKKQRH